jgi:hypothetical protein
MKEKGQVRANKSKCIRYDEETEIRALTMVIVSFHNAFCGQCSTLLASSSRPRAMDLHDDWKILEQVSSIGESSTEQWLEEVGTKEEETRVLRDISSDIVKVIHS